MWLHNVKFVVMLKLSKWGYIRPNMGKGDYMYMYMMVYFSKWG